MKKIFISCPMKGRTEEDIRKTKDKMNKYAELVLGSFELNLIEQSSADTHCKACLIVTSVWIVWVHCDTSL